ncbi:MAG: dihydrodipicolinate synthase family protein [Comamonas sp.]|uniref:dihydrodipicolinate synthase family protein n=1 Tax=Comamonas sp. TaxID=34028 RepID=UPI002FCC3565
MTTPSPNLQGVFSPVLTPFSADLRPDPDRFVKHCRWLLDQDVGLAIFGTNSEAASLSLRERIDLLEHLVANGIAPDRLMPGTASCSLTESIEMTRAAVAAGCAGVLMLPPFYYKGVSDEGLYRSFATIIDAVADARLKIYLYHIPPVSQVPISLALIERLLRNYPGAIAGVKDSSGDLDGMLTMIREFSGQGFSVFAGTEALLLANRRAGGAGCITATGNVNPTAIMRLYREWQGPDADLQQQALIQSRGAFAQFPMIPGMKAAIAWKSGRSDWLHVRPPLLDLDENQQQALQAALGAVGFDIPNAAQLA